MSNHLADFIIKARKEKDLSQRQLAEMAGISNTEVWRIEAGERKNPSPATLKSLAPHLGIPYEELMAAAGYIEETVDHKGYTEMIYRDEDNNIVDIGRRAKVMYDADSDWANLAYRVSTSELTGAEMDLIKAQTRYLLEQFLKNKQ